MKKTRLILLPLLVLTSSLWADLVLEDYEGTVEVKAGSAWKTLDVGAKVAPDATLRLSGHGLAELTDGPVRVHIDKDGSYQLAALVAKAKTGPSSNMVALVSDKAGKLLGARGVSGGPVSNMGVRGAEADPNAGLAWADEEEPSKGAAPSGVIADLETLVNAGEYDKALAQADAALKQPGSKVPGLHLMKARILGQMGRAAASLREASVETFTVASPFYTPAVLLISTQALLLQNYDLVLAKTKEGLQAKSDAEVTQNLEFLQALALRGQGQEKQAQDMLKRVVAENPNSPAGRQASQLLKS